MIALISELYNSGLRRIGDQILAKNDVFSVEKAVKIIENDDFSILSLEIVQKLMTFKHLTLNDPKIFGKTF